MPTAPGKEIRDIVHICERLGVPTKTVPGVFELLDGKVSVGQVRNVELADLLRRAPIHTDLAAVRSLVAGRRVLITGGGGSIGSELARQLYQCDPFEMVLLGHGENSIFDIYHELRRWQADSSGEVTVDGEYGDGKTRLRALIADIRSPGQVQAILQEVRPQIVFHAAAHKHVPLMESNPAEAVFNNVIGTRTLLRAAHEAGVERLVMISTDKAVNPSSVMGATKRVAEFLVHQAAAESGRPYVAVRFGNVLGSRGSVVHTFQRQIAAGGPITVTHPDVKRYFMTIPEAVQLVLQASVLGHGGDVLVLDMGEPVKIADLAEDLIRLSGYEPGRDIQISYTGLRRGDKLFEEMFVEGEQYERTRHEQILIAANASQLCPADLDAKVDALHQAALSEDSQQVLGALCSLVPEFEPFSLERKDRIRFSNGPGPVVEGKHASKLEKEPT